MKKKTRTLSSLSIERERLSPDYNVITKILSVCSNDMLRSIKMTLSKAREKYTITFIIKAEYYQELFHWLSLIGQTKTLGKAAEGLTNDLIFHLYGYMNFIKL